MNVIINKFSIKRNKVILIELILQIASLILLFIRGMYTEIITVISGNTPEVISVLGYDFGFIFSTRGDNKHEQELLFFHPVIKVIFIALIVIGILITVISLFKEENFFKSKLYSIVHFAVLTSYSTMSVCAALYMEKIFMIDFRGRKIPGFTYTADLSVLFYVELVILALICILDFSRRFIKISKSTSISVSVDDNFSENICWQKLYFNLYFDQNPQITLPAFFVDL